MFFCFLLCQIAKKVKKTVGIATPYSVKAIAGYSLYQYQRQIKRLSAAGPEKWIFNRGFSDIS